jgi:hypothetical protein
MSNPQTNPALELYIKEKLEILKQLKVKVTASQRKHFRTLQNEIQVDNFAHTLIFGNKATPYEQSFMNNPNRYSAPVGAPRYV